MATTRVFLSSCLFIIASNCTCQNELCVHVAVSAYSLYGLCVVCDSSRQCCIKYNQLRVNLQ